MAFLESPRFSDRLARGITGGPEFATEIIAVRSGFESRNKAWSQARLRWDAASAIRKLSDFREIEDHFYAVGGRHTGFRMRDHADYQVTTSNGRLIGLHGTVEAGTSGFGYGVPVYQLQKRYTRGTLVYDRAIRKPVSGQVAVRRGGSAVTVGSGAGQISIDTTTGLITFVADATRTVTGVTVGTTTQITVSGSALPTVGVGGRLYLTGLAGADAALLNDLSHAVTGLSGTVYTISTNTAGRVISPGSGVAAAYPQPSEALDWSGQFDVPVRFDTDHLQRTLVGRDPSGELLVQAASIPIVEIRV
jgi:uncharacterized protein (TIGR02217 family)